MSIQTETLSFDPDALALKYREERDKRVRLLDFLIFLRLAPIKALIARSGDNA